jgi:hypothetical protein
MWAFVPGNNKVRHTTAREEGLLLHSLRQADGVKRTADRKEGDGWSIYVP